MIAVARQNSYQLTEAKDAYRKAIVIGQEIKEQDRRAFDAKDIAVWQKELERLEKGTPQ